jgi:hypothetical protein
MNVKIKVRVPFSPLYLKMLAPEAKLKFVMLVFRSIKFKSVHRIQRSLGRSDEKVNSISPALWFGLRFCLVIWTVANLG